MIGVTEKTKTIKNTPLTDRLKNSILDKARSCFPPVSVEMFSEKGKVGEIIRIEIDSGEFKPYCTHGGTYKIRGDGANWAIKPPELLKMFLEREGSQFLARFTEATKQLEENVEKMKDSVERTLDNIYDDVLAMDRKIEEGMGEIGDRVTEAFAEAEASNNATENIERSLGDLKEIVPNVEDQAKLLLDQQGIEDPRETRRRNQVFDVIEIMWKWEPNKTKATYLKLLQAFMPGLERKYLAELYDQKATDRGKAGGS